MTASPDTPYKNGSDWYVANPNGKSDGPYTKSQIADLYGLGQIKHADLIWHASETDGRWIPAHNVLSNTLAPTTKSQQSSKAIKVKPSPSSKKNDYKFIVRDIVMPLLVTMSIWFVYWKYSQNQKPKQIASDRSTNAYQHGLDKKPIPKKNRVSSFPEESELRRTASDSNRSKSKDQGSAYQYTKPGSSRSITIDQSSREKPVENNLDDAAKALSPNDNLIRIGNSSFSASNTDLAATNTSAETARGSLANSSLSLRDVKPELDYRTWRDVTGQFSVVGKYVEVDEESVTLLKQGSEETILVPINKLSPVDVDILARIKSAFDTEKTEERLKYFTVGIRDFVLRSRQLAADLEKLQEDNSLTSITKEIESRRLLADYAKVHLKKDVYWHVKINDVGVSSKYRARVYVKDVFSSEEIKSNLSTLEVPLELEQQVKLKKGQILRLRCKFATVSEVSFYIPARSNNRYGFVVNDVDFLKSGQEELLDDAQAWFSSLRFEKLSNQSGLD